MREILENKRNFCIILMLFFLLAVFLRLDLFLFNRSFWFDEAALAMNVINHGYDKLFGALLFEQSAPPLFLAEAKFLTKFWGISEQVFRFIPLLISIFCIPFFYYYSKYFLNSRASRLIAVFLFAINTNLIYYSQEFKPYALDVFISIIAPLLLFKLKLRHPLWLGLLFALFPWYSYSSGIVIFALVLVVFSELIYHKKSLKNFLLFLLPQVISLFLFAIHLGAIEPVSRVLHNMWSASYINYDFSNFITLVLDNIYYLFHPYKFISKTFPYLLPLVFALICFIGAVILFKKNKFKFLMLLSPYFMFLICAYFAQYPYYDRLTLFLTPIFIVLFVSAFDKILKNPSRGVIGLFLVIILSIYPVQTSQSIMKNLPAQDFSMFNKFHQMYQKGDKVVIDPTSAPSFYYFSKRYKFTIPDEDIILEPYYTSSPKYLIHLTSLDKGNNYWFYKTSITRQKTVDTKPLIEFWGLEHKNYNHYSKGKTDLYYVGK